MGATVQFSVNNAIENLSIWIIELLTRVHPKKEKRV